MNEILFYLSQDVKGDDLWNVWSPQMSCKIYKKQQTIDQSNKLVYDLMLMTKEFNNKHNDSNTVMFMGKKPLFTLIKWRERAYNLSLGVENPSQMNLSSKPQDCLLTSLVLSEFCQILDATTYSSSLYPWGVSWYIKEWEDRIGWGSHGRGAGRILYWSISSSRCPEP